MATPRTLTRLATLAAVAVMVVAPFGLPRAAALPTEACSPSPKDSTSFCATLDQLAPSTTQAAKPFNLDAAFHNSSTNHISDPATWIDHVDLHLLGTNSAAPLVIPSNLLPDELVLAGDDSDCSTNFAACDAGHGGFVANVTEAPIENGVHTGTFGILRIVNENDATHVPGANSYLYRMDLDVCVDSATFGTCALHQTPSIEIGGPIPSGERSGTFDLTLPLWQEGDTTVQGAHVHYAGTVDSAEVHVRGSASTLAGGAPAPGGPFRVFRLPPKCGTATGAVTFATHQVSPRSVTVDQPAVILTGCPTASFTKSLGPGSVHFDGSASTAAVEGRDIHRWLWRFGDGTRAAEVVPETLHQYPLNAPSPPVYNVRLVVEDSAGALSKAALRRVRGTATSVEASTTSSKVLVTGLVQPARPDGKIVQVMLRRLGNDGRYHLVPGGDRHVGLHDAGHFNASYPRPAAGTCKVLASYLGDRHYLPSQRISSPFDC